ncbi:MAG TPA: ABC transporter permease [Xanthobacteraceae bacterium]|nr:ABC transporter permease [Xanthobacteraceae bacterium]
MMKAARTMLDVLKRSYSIMLLLAGWEAAVRLGFAPPALLPAPSVVALALVRDLGEAHFLSDLALTLYRLFTGLVIAIGAGVLIGIGAAQSRLGPLLLEPLIRVLSPLPKIVFFPAFLLLLGFGSSPRIVLVVIDAIFPALLAAYFGARAIDEKLIWSARAAGMSQAACVFRVALPAALPSILTGVRIAIVIGCVVVFLSEMVAPGDGLGDALIRAARGFQTVQMFVPLVTISLLGFVLDYAVVRLRNTLVNW